MRANGVKLSEGDILRMCVLKYRKPMKHRIYMGEPSLFHRVL